MKQVYIRRTQEGHHETNDNDLNKVKEQNEEKIKRKKKIPIMEWMNKQP